MEDDKISELTALTTPATGDLIPIVDVSDTTDAATGTTKKITLANLKASGADVDTGTEDVKFVTPKSLADAGVYQAGGTDVAIADGGTGQSTATAAFDALAPTTTEGDIIYHNGTDNVRLAKGTAGQALKMNSGATAPEWGGVSGKLETDTTEVTISNSAVETTLFDYSVPAGTLGTNNAIRFEVFFSALSLLNTGGHAFYLKLKYGATTICSVDVGNPASNISGLKGYLRGHLVADGATNAQKAGLLLTVFESGGEAATATAVERSKFIGAGNGTATEDSTAAKTLSITGQFSNASGSNNMTVEFWVVDKIV